MILLSVSSSLVLTFLLLFLCYNTHSAPTHHLTIGVQGNTPTLIVTSSEIGITPQTVGSKKSSKPEYVAKSSKEMDGLKKPIKSKFIKNHALNNKKDKLPYLAKPLTKQTLKEEVSHKSLESKKDQDKSIKHDTNPIFLSMDQTIAPLKLEVFKTTPVTPTTTKFSETNLQLTSLPPEQIYRTREMSSTIAPKVNTAQTEIFTTASPQASTELLSKLLNDNLSYTPAMSTTLKSKDFEDIITTLNYDDDTNAVTTSDALINMQTETNDAVSQTQKKTQNSKETNVIKIENENDNDRYTQEPVATTENGNLLLTTIETKAFTTPTAPAAIYTPTLVTLIADNAEATTTSELPLTMTTTATENVFVDDVNDDNSSKNKSEQQQQATEYVVKGIYGETNEDAKSPAKAESQTENNGEYTTEKISAQQSKDNLESTENPVQYMTTETTQESEHNATANVLSQTKVETVTTRKTKTLLTTPPSALTATATLKTSPEYQETSTKPPDQSIDLAALTMTTTEAVLKLIDLEKPVLKTIDDLKQPSLLMAGQHDNGHDGLKNIKKKQLVDKHYVEALLHNKQDIHVKDSITNDKLMPLTTQAIDVSDTTYSSTSSPLTTVTSKSLLMPIKHGYLGPILMEEKTFHVIRHGDNGMTTRNQHVDDMETLLRKHNFVELKAKQEIAETEEDKTKEIQIFAANKVNSFPIEDKDSLEMQSDQPAQILNKKDLETFFKNKKQGNLKVSRKEKIHKKFSQAIPSPAVEQKNTSSLTTSKVEAENLPKSIPTETAEIITYFPVTTSKTPKLSIQNIESKTENSLKEPSEETSYTKLNTASLKTSGQTGQQTKTASVLSTTVFHAMDLVATKTPMVQADTLFTSQEKETTPLGDKGKEKTESKISDIQIEVYDSTMDSIVASTNFKDIKSKHHSTQTDDDELVLGKTTRPPVATIQQERFTQYVIDRTETSTHEPINYSTIQVASGKPEPAAIEIHINVSESFGNESEDLEFSYPQTEYNNNNNERIGEESYDDTKVNNNIKLKIPTNSNGNGKDLRNDEILVVEIIDTDNITDLTFKGKSKNTDELFITADKEVYNTPPPPPPPPPYQTKFDRDSDTIFYISNTEVKVGESLPSTKNANEERKLKLESQFFPANYMASTHPNLNNPEDQNPHHLYEEDIILSPSRNHADSLKIYRNRNEPPPPLDVTYVGESIIEVEQSPDSIITTTYAPDQQHNLATPQADVIIQPAILPEISIGVPVIGELPPQIELKEIDFMPNEAQLHRSGIYDDNDSSNSNNNINLFGSDIDENTINGGGNNNNNHDVDIASSNSNNNQRVDESSIQYGGDLIDESADGGFDGVEGSYPFGNPASNGKSSSSTYSSAFLTKLRKQQQQQQQQPNHVADYAHLYINYGVNNMRKDELNADVKDSGEILLVSGGGGGGNINVASNEQNTTSFKDFLNKVSMSNTSLPFMSANSTQSERISNATAFSVMEDANDLDDKNTEDIINLISLAIGLFIVILPVVVTCSMFWALRYLYKKYHTNLPDNGGYTDQTETKGALNDDDGVEKGEFVHEPSSSPANSYKDTLERHPDTSNKPSTTNSNVKFLSEKPSSLLESTSSKTNTATTNPTSATVSKTNDTLKLSLALSSPKTQKQAQPPPSASASNQIHTVHCDVDNENGGGVGVGDDDDVEMPGPNGSITKITLENNLLIVETEERNDISRVARETKMDYNKDGVFVVEVARGIDSKNIPESPVTDGNEKMLSMFDTKHNNGGLTYKMTNEKNCINNEKVQIHSPPSENQEEGPRSLHQIEEVEEPINSPHLNENKKDEVVGLAYKAKTGLSQSDLSTSSSCDSNKDYCYGNQELYVVEQNVYSPATPNGNVVLKCDEKDIKDDDRNPGNDHYLKHSPGRREELSKDREDIVDTTKEPEERGSRSSSGESPEQKPNDKAYEKLENAIEIKKLPNLLAKETPIEEIYQKESRKEQPEICHDELKLNLQANAEEPLRTSIRIQNFAMPVEIEVHITPAEVENSSEETSLSPIISAATAEPSSVFEENENETISPIVEDSLTIETLPPVEPPAQNIDLVSANCEEEEVLAGNIQNGIAILAVPDNFTDNEASEDDVSSIKAIEKEEESCQNSIPNVTEIKTADKKVVKENIVINENESKEQKAEEENNLLLRDSLNGLETNEMAQTKEADLEKNENTIDMNNDLVSNGNINLHSNGLTEADEIQMSEKENTLDIKKDHAETLNGTTHLEEASVTNGLSDLTDLETKLKAQPLQNGQHAGLECITNSLAEMENGFDSIMSLPEPPPTTDEQLNSDLSDQQLDSLPPPPPPEIFNLKDLPPPLINGNAESPQSEESNNFYNTLPPPPPTTLEVTASAETSPTTTTTNGKVHASPLTPPASPPAHFTNNLHAGLCSQPIAVNVNGS